MEIRTTSATTAPRPMPQAFLETDEDRFLIARLDIDHAVWHEPGLREGRGDQILPCDAPEHLARVRAAPTPGDAGRPT